MELLKKPDMHLFFEKQIRGEVPTAFHRFAKANNKFMKDFDPSKPSTFIGYFDANSLYPTAMCKPLPLRDFEWMNEKELQNWETILKTDGKGCVLEVDLHYPQHLHDDHNDYPLAPERLKINGVEKLTPNLQDKKNMVLHAASLKQYLDLGLELQKIHAGVKFILEDYMRPFIELNTKMRTAAKNAFEKDFYLCQIQFLGKHLKMFEIVRMLL